MSAGEGLPPSTPRLVSVNVGRPRTVRWRGRSLTSAMWKAPVDGPVAVRGVNLDGDDQADRRVHGGADKAVYAYAVEDYRWWAGEVGTIERGAFGENLTTEGLDLRCCQVGDRWRVGTAELEVAQPRTPCYKLGIRMGDDDFPERFTSAARPGAYLRIATPGEVTVGDPIEVVAGSPPGLPLSAFTLGPLAHDVARRMAADDRVPERWRQAAARALAG